MPHTYGRENSNMRIFETLHHICIVVRDIEVTARNDEAIGIGPWSDFPPLNTFVKLEAAEGFLNLTYKYASMGGIQVQLCQPGSGDTPQRRFLDEKGEGVYHVGFDVPNIESATEAGKQLGLKVLSFGRRPDGSGFTYFDSRDSNGVVLEVRSANPIPS